MNSQNQYTLPGILLVTFCLFFCLLLSYNQANAQEKPPRPITVTVNTAQHLSFGSFIVYGSGGTVTVDYTGNRPIPTGNIIGISNMRSLPISAALYIVDAEPGTLITIVNGPPAYLTGNNGGTIRLDLGEPSTKSQFVTPIGSQYTDVFIGGTLTIGSLMANPPGVYNGTFQVTFIQQ